MVGGAKGHDHNPRSSYRRLGLKERADKETLSVEGRGARPTPVLVSAYDDDDDDGDNDTQDQGTPSTMMPIISLTKLNVIRDNLKTWLDCVQAHYSRLRGMHPIYA